MTEPRTAGRRRFDPVRRDRMIDAGLEVVRTRGVRGLTFRAVAEQADVPLGSTTYHFGDKIELVAEVLRLARERSRDLITASLDRDVAVDGLAVASAKLVATLTGEGRADMTVAHELFFSVLTHTELRGESRRWSMDGEAEFARFTDPVNARTLSVFFDGICMRSVLFDEPYPVADVLPLIRTIVDADPGPARA